MFRWLTLLFFTLTLCALFTQSLPSKTETSGTFTLGVWYGGGKMRAPTLSRDPASSYDDWVTDLQTIYSLGFNAIKVWVDWATIEAEQGVYDFSDLEQVLSIIEDYDIDLKVVVQVYADSAPEWVGTLYDDAEFVGSNDRHIHSQAAPGYCLDHPGVRSLVLNFYEQVGAAAAQYSDLIYAFDVWSEPHIVNWIWFWDMDATEVEFCYCDYSLARFRTWLQTEYNNSLDDLNNAWYRTFSSWDQVEPPRFSTIITYTDFLDWLYRYSTDKLAEDLAAKASAIETGFGNSVIVTSHSASPSVINSPLSDYGTPDDWKMFTHLQDFSTNSYYGTSIYPYHAEAPLGGRDALQLSYMFSGEYSASRGNGFFVGELQAGQGATGIEVNVPVTASDQRDWIWSLIAHGAKSIFMYAYYPMNTGYEVSGYGLINLDGTTTDRSISSGEIAEIVTKYQDLIASAYPEPAQFAILYNPLAYFSGGNTVGPGTDIYHSQLGVYGAMFSRGTSMPIAFVHSDDVEDGILLENQYKVVYLPFPIAISSACASALKEYVYQGGMLISEARLAWTDEAGNANEIIPGLGLDEVFGVKENILRPVLTTGTRGCLASYSYTFDELDDFGLAGLTVPSELFEETLTVTGNDTVILASFDSDGSPAVVESAYGKGKTIFFGGYLGLAAYANNANATEVIQALYEWAGIDSLVIQVKNAVSGLDVRIMLTDSDEFLLIAVNRGATSCSAVVELGVSATKAYDIITEQYLSVATLGSSDILVALPKNLGVEEVAAVWLY